MLKEGFDFVINQRRQQGCTPENGFVVGKGDFLYASRSSYSV